MSELEFMRIIGKNIKYELEDAWMTQKELAEATGISRSTISKYINAEVMPSLVNINNIANVLDCSIDKLIGHNREMIERY